MKKTTSRCAAMTSGHVDAEGPGPLGQSRQRTEIPGGSTSSKEKEISSPLEVREVADDEVWKPSRRAPCGHKIIQPGREPKDKDSDGRLRRRQTEEVDVEELFLTDEEVLGDRRWPDICVDVIQIGSELRWFAWCRDGGYRSLTPCPDLVERACVQQGFCLYI